MDTADQPGGTVLIHLDVGAMAAGIHQHHTVAQTGGLGGVPVAKDHKGVVVMAGGPAGGGHRLDGAGQRGALHLPFHGVAAMEVDQIPLTEGQIQAQGSDLLQPEGFGAVVAQPCSAGNDILVGKHTVQKVQLQAGDKVPQCDAQGAHLVSGLSVGTGQSLQGILARFNPVGYIDKIRTGRTRFVAHHQAGQPEIAHIAAGVFLGEHIGRNAAFPAAGIVVRRKAMVGTGVQCAQITLADGAAIVQVQQMPPFVYLHVVAGVCGLQRKNACGGVELNAHKRTSLKKNL